MSRALSPSFARCYGLARVARAWKISRASVYRSLKETPPNTITHRPGPVGACSDAELADHIRRQIDASRLHGESYRKLWARLRFAGIRASPRRVRRVMRLLAPWAIASSFLLSCLLVSAKLQPFPSRIFCAALSSLPQRTARIGRQTRGIGSDRPCGITLRS